MRRGKRRNRGGGDTYVYSGNTYKSVNSYTTLNMYGSQDSYAYRHKQHVQDRRQNGERRERPPKLTRYCVSCGLMDRHLVSRMSESELMDESAKVVAYGAKGLCNGVCDVAGGVVGLAGSLLADFVGIIRDMI